MKNMKNKNIMVLSVVALAITVSFSAFSSDNSIHESLKAPDIQEKINQIKTLQTKNTVTKPISKFAQWRNNAIKKRKLNVTDQFIVTFEQQTSVEQFLVSAKSTNQAKNQLINSLQNSIGQEIKAVKSLANGQVILSVGKTLDFDQAQFMAKKLTMNVKVRSAEPDPRRYRMAENQPLGISAVQGDIVSDNEAGNMTVCIIDSGYDINNPDLSGNLVNGTNNSGTGSWATPGGSHGTHVAGTIAAINNNEGVVGVLPNQNVNLHIIKVFNESGWAYSSDLVGALGKCEDAGADVVNMSLGGSGSSNTERNSLQSYFNNGMLLIAAAGNDGDSSLSYPASYDSVVSVAAVDETGLHAAFSQYTNQVEVAGPGVAVLSTVGIGDGRQGYITFNGQTAGDDNVLSPNRYVETGGNFTINNINANSNGIIGACTRSGSNYSCNDMANKICIVERYADQSGSSYPEIDPAKACANAGASGIVVFSKADKPGLQNPFLVDRSNEVTVPVVSVNRALGLQLVAAVGQTADLQVIGNTDYAYYNGTSMATPHVAGVAALAWSKNRICTAQQVRQALSSTALDLDVSGRDIRTGFGLVQAQAASNYLTTLCASNGTGGGGGTGGGTGGGDPSVSILENGIAETNISAARNVELNYIINIPEGASNLIFNLTDGSGDADLYVTLGSEPSTSNYDCRSWSTGNTEVCRFTTVNEGTYYVKVVAYAAFSGASLKASYIEDGATGAAGDTIQYTKLAAKTGDWEYREWDVPAGMSSLTFTTNGGDGDADLYIRLGNNPTTSEYECRSWQTNNTEVCTVNNPQAGTWHIGVHAYSTFSGVTLDAAYNP